MDGAKVRCDLVEPTKVRDETGQPETVLLLHGSAGSSTLWRRTIDALRPLYRTLAPDLIGYGGSAPWPPNVPFDLEVEARAVQKLLPCCGHYHLVGYSYGGTVALHLALAHPRRVLSLTLIEPVFFAALRYAADTEAYDALCRVRDDFVAMLTRGDRELAMQRFIDFWTGSGAWARLPVAMRESMLGMVGKIVLDWQASFAADPGPERLVPLAPRTLLMCGDKSPEPMRRLVDALHALMPASERLVVPGANHLLPLTHASALTSALMTQFHATSERRMR
jgi:pimeloyl-ACP methyl ester carboxylesterase